MKPKLSLAQCELLSPYYKTEDEKHSSKAKLLPHLLGTEELEICQKKCASSREEDTWIFWERDSIILGIRNCLLFVIQCFLPLGVKLAHCNNTGGCDF